MQLFIGSSFKLFLPNCLLHQPETWVSSTNGKILEQVSPCNSDHNDFSKMLIVYLLRSIIVQISVN